MFTPSLEHEIALRHRRIQHGQPRARSAVSRSTARGESKSIGPPLRCHCHEIPLVTKRLFCQLPASGPSASANVNGVAGVQLGEVIEPQGHGERPTGVEARIVDHGKAQREAEFTVWEYMSVVLVGELARQGGQKRPQRGGEGKTRKGLLGRERPACVGKPRRGSQERCPIGCRAQADLDSRGAGSGPRDGGIGKPEQRSGPVDVASRWSRRARPRVCLPGTPPWLSGPAEAAPAAGWKARPSSGTAVAGIAGVDQGVPVRTPEMAATGSSRTLTTSPVARSGAVQGKASSPVRGEQDGVVVEEGRKVLSERIRPEDRRRRVPVDVPDGRPVVRHDRRAWSKGLVVRHVHVLEAAQVERECQTLPVGRESRGVHVSLGTGEQHAQGPRCGVHGNQPRIGS